MKLTNVLSKLFFPSILSLLLVAAVWSTAGQDMKVITNPQLRSVVNAAKQNSGRPPVLSPAEKIQQLKKFPGSRLLANSSLNSPITLTVSNSYVKNRALLFIVLPDAIWPDESGSHAAFGDDRSVSIFSNGLAVKFIAPAAGKYLVDFSVVGVPGDKFTVAQDGGSGAAEAGQVVGKHVLLTIEAKQINQTIIVGLHAEKAWNFYACEISQINQK